MREIKKGLFLILILINFMGCLNDKVEENTSLKLTSMLVNGNSSLEAIEGKDLKVTLESKDAEGDSVNIIILSEGWEKEGTDYVYQNTTIANTTVPLEFKLNDGKNEVKISRFIKILENTPPKLNSILLNGNSSLEVVEGEELKIDLEIEDKEGDPIEITILSDGWQQIKIGYIYQNETLANTNIEFKIKLSDGENEVLINKTIKIITLEEYSKKELTFLIYLAADNNLNDMANLDIEEIKKANIDEKKINVVIYADFESSQNPGIFIKDGNSIEMVKSLGEFNTGDKANLKDAINYVEENYSAKRYILDIWNHGDGWYDDKLKNKNNPSKSIAVDDTSYGDSLDLWELEDAISKSNIPKFDIVYMDACLMGGIEVSYQLKDVADYLAFSPELTPGQGGDYIGVLESINENLELATIKDIAIKIQDVNFKSYQKGGRQYIWGNNNFDDYGLIDAVYSVVDLEKTDELMLKFNNVVNDLIDNDQIDINLNEVIQYNYGDEYYYDLVGILEGINKTENNEKIEEIIKFIQEEYIVYFSYQNYDSNEDGMIEIDYEDYQKSSGLSIYFKGNDFKNREYENASSFGRDTKWVKVLNKYDN